MKMMIKNLFTFKRVEEHIETAYSSEADITFIIKYTTLGNDNVRMEIIGFYFGEPDENATQIFKDKGLVAII